MLWRQFDQHRPDRICNATGRIGKARVVCNPAGRHARVEIEIVQLGKEQLQIGLGWQHEEFFVVRPSHSFVPKPLNHGLPARSYLPIVIVFALVFLATLGYLVRLGFGTSGSLFGSATGTPGPAATSESAQPQAVSVQGGGPPPAVRMQLEQLRRRIAQHPKDDVALTELGDMYSTVGKLREALPLYKRALSANPGNVAAREGLDQAQSALTSGQ